MADAFERIDELLPLSKGLESRALFDISDGDVLDVWLKTKPGWGYVQVNAVLETVKGSKEYKKGNRTPKTFSRVQKFVDGISGGALRQESITAKGVASSVKGGDLKALFIDAWCVARGVKKQTAEELAAELDEARGAVIEALKTGPFDAKRVRALYGRLHRLRTRLNGVDLRGCDLSKVVFPEVRLRKANLSSTTLQETVFKGCDLSGVVFDNANVKNARFINCVAKKTSFEGVDLKAAKSVELRR